MDLIRALPAFIIFLLIVYLLYRYYSKSELKVVFWPALILKLAAGIFIGVLYKYYYDYGDTFLFFNDAKILAGFATEDPAGYLSYLWNSSGPQSIIEQLNYTISSPRAVWFSKFTSLLYLGCGNNYYLIASFYSLFAFSASFYLVKCISENFENSKWPAIIGILFFPSVVLWGSGLTKESLAVGCIMFLISLTIQWINSDQKKIKYLLSVIFLLWLLWKIKYYYAGLLAPALLAILIPALWKKYVPKINISPVILWLASFLIFVFIATLSKQMLDLDLLPRLITESYETYVEKSGDGDYIVFSGLNNEWSGIIKNIPMALVSGISRPWLGDINNAIKIPTAIENTLLILLFFSNLKFFYQQIRKMNLWLMSAFLYIFGLATFLAMAAPNLGTLTRYKAGWLFIFTFLILYQNSLVERLFKKLKLN